MFAVNDKRLFYSKFRDAFVCTNPKAGSSLWRKRAFTVMPGGQGYSFMGRLNDTLSDKVKGSLSFILLDWIQPLLQYLRLMPMVMKDKSTALVCISTCISQLFVKLGMDVFKDVKHNLFPFFGRNFCR